MSYIPTIVEKTKDGTRSWDPYSRLLKDRIVLLGDEVDDEIANSIVAQLLFLHKEDPELDIHFYINSPGGVCTAGLAMMDIMDFISNDVCTYVIGQACSMGAFLLSCGTKGKRYAMPSARIMIHQPSGGARGKSTDMEVTMNEMIRLRYVLNNRLAENTDHTIEQIEKDTKDDKWMDATEAKAFGLIDHVITRKTK